MLLDLNKHTPLHKTWEPPSENEFTKISNAARLLVIRRYKIVVVFMIISLLGGLVYLKLTPPTYTASVEIDILNHEADFLRQQATLSEPPIDMLRETALAKSDVIADTVVRTLKLDGDPEFNTYAGSLKWLRLLWTEFVGNAGYSPFQSAVAAVQSGTRATDSGASSSIDIEFTCREPEKAAEIANALASAFIDLQRGGDAEIRNRANGWLVEQSNEMRRQADDADAKVADFIKTNNLVTVDGKLLHQNLADVNAKLAAAKDKMLDAKAKYENLDSIVSNMGTQDILALTSSPEVLQDPIIVNARERYIDVKNQIMALQRDYNKDSQKLTTLMAVTKSEITDELTRLRDNFHSEYDAAADRYEQLKSGYTADTEVSQRENVLESKLKELQGTAQNFKTLYENFLQHSAGSIQEFTFPIRGHQISEMAKPPLEKSWPKTGIVLAGAAFLGLAFGVAAGLLRDITDHTFRTAAQFEAAMRIKCVGLIPKVEGWRNSPRTAWLPEEVLVKLDRHTEAPLWWKVKVSPNSRYASELTAVRLALHTYKVGTRARVIGMTSAFPGEGKTSLVGSLAVLMAKSGRKIAIVDLDFRKGRLSEGFASSLPFGLADVLSERCGLEDAMYHDPNLGVTVIPCGSYTDALQPVEMITSSKLKECIGRLGETHDYVLVDLPPLVPVADVRATSEFIQGYLLTVEWATTNAAVFKRAIESYPELSGKIIGSVLNKVDFKTLSKYDPFAGLYYTNPEFMTYRDND